MPNSNPVNLYEGKASPGASDNNLVMPVDSWFTEGTSPVLDLDFISGGIGDTDLGESGLSGGA